MRTASLTEEKQGGFDQNKVNPASLSSKGQATKHKTKSWSVGYAVCLNVSFYSPKVFFSAKHF